MNHEAQIYKLAKQRGLRLNDLSVSEYQALALEVRTAREKIRDIATAVESYAVTSLGLRTVSLKVAQQNEAKCRSNECGSFDLLKGNVPVCHRCNCSNKFLGAKWKDRKHKCPIDLWDNTKIPEEELDAT